MSFYSDIAPFPNTFPTAPLLKISFKALVAGSSEEAARLFAAARDTGIFYLDLYGAADGELILDDVDEMFSLAEKLCDIDEEEREYLRSTMTKGSQCSTALVTTVREISGFERSNVSCYRYESSENRIVDDEGRRGWSESFMVGNYLHACRSSLLMNDL
jgi:isopenicillin N synthase-like dioxygenase